MDYNNGQEHPITIHTSVMSDYEDYALPPKQSKRSFCYSLTGLTIGCKQAEQESKQEIHHHTTADFNLNGYDNSHKPVVIMEEKDKQPTTAAYNSIFILPPLLPHPIFQITEYGKTKHHTKAPSKL